MVILYLDIKDADIHAFLNRFLFGDFSFIEIFEDGEVYFYDETLTLYDKILLFLNLPRDTDRISRKRLDEAINPKKGYLPTYLKNLKDKKLIHENSDGIKLTRIGIQNAIKLLKEKGMNKSN